ncbi:MAG TPA: CusA/CzcA family heavy metal efflux RND transporter [Gemmatimonadales bacterium]|nr:CusA/CzcA family heavy metal efflux RND transporter [Gemmatimonadales bacterium]
MISRLVEWALTQRLLVVLGALGIVGGGYLAVQGLAVDAFPDVSPVLVQVTTESPGLAPPEVEALVTYPVEVAMNGLPGVTRIQSISAFGLSQVNVYFRDEVDIYFARQLVFERLESARDAIPAGLGDPALGPVTTGLGQVYQYLIVGEGLSLDSLRTIQDWVVKPQLRAVPGVTEVLSFGGHVKQFQVQLDPNRLVQYGVTVEEVIGALERNNANAGGGFIVRSPEEYLVRGLGFVTTLEDIGTVIVAERENTPVYVRNVGRVAIGAEVRRGAVSVNGEGEAVAGIVLKRIYENTSSVIEGVRAQVKVINAAMPPGVRLVPFYDQADLVDRAVATVRDALLEGGALILLVLLLFLGNLRSALIVGAMLPACTLLAFILMRLTGLSANLMSLGGLAIGIGMMVDGGVVMVENIYRVLSEPGHENLPRVTLVRRAALEVARPISFAIAIIIIVFLPLFTLQGVEGKLFTPLAYTITFAMIGSLLLSMTLIPVLCSLGLKGGAEEDTWVLRHIRRRYEPMLDWALGRRRTVMAGAVGALLLSLAMVPFLGTEFVPPLEEGSILYRATLAPSAGLDEAIRVAAQLEREAMSFPEVIDAVSKIGRAELGGDPEPVNNVEVTVTLQPMEVWTSGRTKDQLVDAMRERMAAVPGIALNFSQPIATRVDELLSGVRAQLAIKVFGDDLDSLASIGDEVQRVVSRIEGAQDVQTEQLLGQPQLLVRVDRVAVARLGLNVDDVLGVVRLAIGGGEAGKVFEGQRRFDIWVRYGEPYRATPEDIARALIPTPSGGRVPLSQVATIELAEGPKQISREANQRRIVVQANVDGRDLGGFVAEAQESVAREVQLPPGYFITWGGQFENQQRAMARLALIVPVTIGLIFLLLFSSFNSLKQAALIILNVPFALIGGIIALVVTRQYLSVPASVGFIALFGVAVLNGVVLVSYINQLRAEGLSVAEAVRRGTLLRLRPVLMTALVASLGLVPLLLASGAGSEIQRPLASVVVGGLVTSTLLTLLLLPVLYGYFEPETSEQ